MYEKVQQENVVEIAVTLKICIIIRNCMLIIHHVQKLVMTLAPNTRKSVSSSWVTTKN